MLGLEECVHFGDLRYTVRVFQQEESILKTWKGASVEEEMPTS